MIWMDIIFNNFDSIRFFVYDECVQQEHCVLTKVYKNRFL